MPLLAMRWLWLTTCGIAVRDVTMADAKIADFGLSAIVRHTTAFTAIEQEVSKPLLQPPLFFHQLDMRETNSTCFHGPDVRCSVAIHCKPSLALTVASLCN
jgi:hypothetical protein